MVYWNSIAVTAIVAIASSPSPVSAFVPSHPLFHKGIHSSPHFTPIQSTTTTTTTQRSETTNDTTNDDNNDKNSIEVANSKCHIPLSLEELISDASQTMEQAYAVGITRQTVRILLPRDSKNAQLGQYYEEDASMMENSGSFGGMDMVLVPPDETWQGGIMQLYRAAAPTCREILRKLSKDVGGVPPKIVEDRSIDDSGVDGVGLLMSQNREPKDDISCFVQPLQETVEAIESISNQAGERLVVMVNPQWRNVDDALDSASKSEGVFGSIASFLGGKGNSLRRLAEVGFQEVYVVEGYVCKGGNVRLVKRFDSDWVIFAENDSETDYLRIGASKTRPSYQDVDEMLNKMGVSLKYARDIGLAPKLE